MQTQEILKKHLAELKGYLKDHRMTEGVKSKAEEILIKYEMSKDRNEKDRLALDLESEQEFIDFKEQSFSAQKKKKCLIM